MERINSLAEFHALELKEKVYEIGRGNSKSFRYLGKNPLCGDAILLASNGDYTKIETVTELTMKYSNFFKGPYDSKFVGNLKIEQLKEQIKSVEEIYLKD